MNRRIVALLAASAMALVISATAADADGGWEVGCRDSYLQGIGYDEIWAAADAVGVKQIEVQVDKRLNTKSVFDLSFERYGIANPAKRKKLKAAFDQHGLTICAFCAGHNFDAGRSDEEALAWLGQVAEAAQEMGVPVIMVPVSGGNDLSDEEFIKRGKEFLGALVPISKKTGVVFALENLQMFWNRAEVLKPVMESLPTENVALAHDVTNMYWYGHPIDKIYPLAETCAPYVAYVHAKNVDYPDDKQNVQREPGWEYGKYAAPIPEGDIDFERILKTYADAGYKGVVTIEDDSLGKFDAEGRKKVLTEDVKYLEGVFAKIEK